MPISCFISLSKANIVIFKTEKKVMKKAKKDIPQPAATKRISTPTRGRSRDGETKLPSMGPFFRPIASQHVAPQNRSSPAFFTFLSSSSPFFSASTADIFESRENNRRKNRFFLFPQNRTT